MVPGPEKMITVSREGLIKLFDLVNAWQNRGEAHLRGCDRTTYYISSCSEKCKMAMSLVGQMTSEEIAKLPISGYEYARSSIDAY
ncbi:MAG: hypothetical protein UU22_C0032G0002 [Parcubacteria group bacterium GW2011_GWA2_40_8]|nr:MAG: hypothetical protein UU22_C0032G0002 [Parcubacteria group bacterium GW2011_GWA2_40_8]